MASSFADTHSAVVVFEPFVPSSVIRPLTDAVFPHAFYASPLNTALWWTDPANDAAGLAALDNTATHFTAALRADGQPVDGMALYPNYADTLTTPCKSSTAQIWRRRSPSARRLILTESCSALEAGVLFRWA